MPRRTSIGAGSRFSTKMDPSDPGVSNEIQITSANQPPNTITCNLVQFDAAGAVSRIDPFAGGLIQRGNRMIAVLRDVLTNKVQFKIIFKGHNNNPTRDIVIIRTERGIGGLRDQLDGKDNSNNGSMADPDAEGFSRSGTPVTTNFPTGTGTVTGNGTLQPGTIVVKNSSGNNYAYDYNGLLYEYSVSSPPYPPIGQVNYGSGYPVTWSVTRNDSTFTGTVEALSG